MLNRGVLVNIGAKIKYARESLELSQTEVASRIPMNQSNYSKIERDLQEPSLQQLKRICQILQLEPAYLLDLDEKPPVSEQDRQLLRDIKQFLATHR